MLIPITDLSDRRIDAYRNLKDRQLVDQNRLIAEGEHLVRRLLASPLSTESVLVSRRRLDRLDPIVPPDVPLYVVPDELIHQIIGFRFHSGVIAVGRRPPSPTLHAVLPPPDRPALLIVIPELISAENLGGIIRLSAGFGADAMILGPRCVDPFYRLAVRVSMGACFVLPILRSEDILRDLALLHKADITTIASVLDPSATPLRQVSPPPRVALVLGNEAQGLTPDQIAACDLASTIPMRRDVDSFNVTTATAIFLYHLTQ